MYTGHGLTPAVLSAFLAALRGALAPVKAAALVSVSRSTFFRWQRRGRKALRAAGDDVAAVPEADRLYADLVISMERVLATALIESLQIVTAAAQDNWQAAAWKLERVWPELFGRDHALVLSLKRRISALEKEITGLIERQKETATV